MTDSNVPNLDAMTPADLWDFWKRCGMSGGVPYGVARDLFPARPMGYVRVVNHLKHYACNKAVAMELRADGKIDRALVYEQICDRIYEGLPDYAKW